MKTRVMQWSPYILIPYFVTPLSFKSMLISASSETPRQPFDWRSARTMNPRDAFINTPGAHET
jgi:hypothetical protein